MTRRKNSPLHNKWHRIVEGQIRGLVHSHPEWFVFKDDLDKATFVNSLAKRIVGEIVAEGQLVTMRTGVRDGASVRGED